jgi:REP element-mobilizing transposase RayT
MEKNRSGGTCGRRKGNWAKPRTKIRLPAEAYRAGETFLLTVCTSENQQLLTQARYGPEALDAMHHAAHKTSASLWCGVIMPEHVHLVVTAQPGKSPLDMAACFKRLTTIAARKRGHQGNLWQRRIHDRGIRTGWNGNLASALFYVLDNPVRRGLVDAWEDWPLSYLHPDIESLA